MTAPHAKDALCGDLLRSVSRSFFLTIEMLPPALRQPVGLAYLLARTSDTIADTVAIPPETRLRHLREFEAAVKGEENSGVVPSLQRDIVSDDTGEQALIGRLGDCLAALHSVSSDDRHSIIGVLEKIIRGQALDIERFGKTGPVHALATAEELYTYTYLVAGCVGDFWTQLCFRHLDRYSDADPERMAQLGVNFGKALQLVNILRDAPVDLRAGRCYLPADQLREAGVEPQNIKATLDGARKVVDRWRRIAVRHFDDAERYIEAVRPLRLRLACFLPWYLGLRTLGLLARTPSLETSQRVKVGRREVRAALALGPFAVCSNFGLQKIHATLRERAMR